MLINTDLTHLPEDKQNTLVEIQRIIRNEIERFVVWIILFGSHARGTYVDNFQNGYVSDYDILVVLTDHSDELVRDTKLWYDIEDKIDLLTRSPVNLIVHTKEEVQEKLKEGHYFFSDIRKDGIYLYTNRSNKGLPEPKKLTNAERWPIAQEHYEQWFESGSEFFENYNFNLEKGRLKNAAFQLHQAAERFYACILLVLSNYRPRTHNLRNLRNMSNGRVPAKSPVLKVFPGNSKFQRRCFELLKKAYVDSRYSKHYKITQEELEWLAEQVEKLKTATKTLCEAHIQKLKQ